MEVNTMEEGENDVAGEKWWWNMDWTKVTNKVIKPKKRAVGETGSELSSDEELKAQFSTVRTITNQRNFQMNI
jgi:hypothetical protein